MKRFLITLLALAVVVGGGIYVWGPDIFAATFDYPPTNFGENSVIYGSDGKEIGSIQASGRGKNTLKDDQISPLLRQSFMAAEDRGFYTHNGIDGWAMVKAGARDLQHGSLDFGGSTLTQQLVKNMYLTKEKSGDRKLREAVYSYKVEHDHTKDEIADLYANSVYFGKGSNGVDDASWAWFGHSAVDIKDSNNPQHVAKAAMLAALVQRPSCFDGTLGGKPGCKDPAALLQARQRDYVLDGFRAIQGIDDSKKVPANVIEAAKKVNLNIATLIKTKPSTGAGNAAGADPYLVDYVKDWFAATEAVAEKQLDTTISDDIAAERGEDAARKILAQGGLKIYTTINPALQTALASAVKFDNNKLGKRGLAIGSTILDPRTGAVVAMYGGADYGKDHLNYATNGAWAVGSTMKTVVLADAVRKEISVQSELRAPDHIHINGSDVFNDDKKAAPGPDCKLSLADAMAYSNNPVHIELITGKMVAGCDDQANLQPLAKEYPVSPHSAVELARKMGAEDSTVPGKTSPTTLEEVPAFTLGVGAMNSLKLASIGGTFANGGVHNKPYIIEKITPIKGDDTPSYENTPQNEQVFDTDKAKNTKYADILNQVLTGVFTKGTARGAQLEDSREAAGKTGTTPSSATGIAWTAVDKDKKKPAYVCAIEAGYPDNRVTSGKGGDLWGADTMKVCSIFLSAALRGQPKVGFAKADLSAGTKIGLNH